MSSDEKKPIKKKMAAELSEKSEKLTLIAKKDFHISHNGYERAIKANDDISDVPPLYYDNLRSEGVL